MRIDRILGNRRPVFSFEFFPPKTDDGPAEPRGHARGPEGRHARLRVRHLRRRRHHARAHGRDHQVDQAEPRHRGDGPPLAGRRGARSGSWRSSRSSRPPGIENVLALRGDPPRGETEWKPHPGGLHYSVELIRLIKERFDFSIGAACFPEVHPEAPDRDTDLRYAREKVEAGAGFLITQLFLDNEIYFDFVEARARRRHRRADHPGHHADHQPEPDQDDHRHVRGHDPGRARARARGARRRPGSGRGARSRLRDSPMLRSPGARRARDPLLHAEPSPATRAILAALRAAHPWTRATAPV